MSVSLAKCTIAPKSSELEQKLDKKVKFYKVFLDFIDIRAKIEFGSAECKTMREHPESSDNNNKFTRETRADLNIRFRYL